MIPKIKVDVGRGLPPVELQQVIDTALLTRNKTVVGAINELLDTVTHLELTGGKPSNGALLETITQDRVNKWDAAQANTIEKIFVNNAEVSIIDKAVNLTIPTKASDIGAATHDHNHDGVYLKANEKIPAALLPDYAGGLTLGETSESAFRGDLGKIAYGHAMTEHAPVNAQENVLETLKVAGETLPVEDKTVDIPTASALSHGVVRSSSGANQVTVEDDGDMRIDVISTSTLKVPIGEEFVLSGGTASGFDVEYSTRINNIGYDSLTEAVSAANYGDVVTMDTDINLGTLDNCNLVVNADNVTLDTNGSTLYASGSNGAIKVIGGCTTITGDGTVSASLGSDNYSMAVWATGGKVIIENGTYRNTTDGSDRGTDLIYASGDAEIEITGGKFIAAKPEWTLNCKDADYKAGTAKIVVKGGSFYKFDPANNNTEGPGTDYVAEGYYSTLIGDYYVVKSIEG